MAKSPSALVDVREPHDAHPLSRRRRRGARRPGAVLSGSLRDARPAYHQLPDGPVVDSCAFYVGTVGLRDQHLVRPARPKKKYLIGAFLLFSVLSFASGLAGTVTLLLLARLLIGVRKAIVPLSHAIIIAESSPGRRGFNMGVVQSVGSQFVGSAVSPLLIVWLATVFNWRTAFYVAALPAIAIALLIAGFIREPGAISAAAPAEARPLVLTKLLKQLFSVRNIRVCALLSCFLNAWYFGLLTFMPLYLVRSLHFSPRDMSHVMACGGLGAVLSSALVPSCRTDSDANLSCQCSRLWACSGPARHWCLEPASRG